MVRFIDSCIAFGCNIELLLVHDVVDISGTLPTEIGNLSKLLTVDIGGTSIEGTMPSHIGLLPNLGETMVASSGFRNSVITFAKLSPFLLVVRTQPISLRDKLMDYQAFYQPKSESYLCWRRLIYLPQALSVHYQMN